jgi:rhodanese-related sulfurtransferase
MVKRKRIAQILAGLSLFSILPLIAPAQEEGLSSPSFPSVKCEELKKMIDSKATDFLVVSNDPQESYDEGHIPGAVSFPWSMQLKLPVTLPRNKTLIFYCSCAHEEDSTDTAAKLAKMGYRNLKVLEGGYLKWSELKYPIEKK